MNVIIIILFLILLVFLMMESLPLCDTVVMLSVSKIKVKWVKGTDKLVRFGISFCFQYSYKWSKYMICFLSALFRQQSSFCFTQCIVTNSQLGCTHHLLVRCWNKTKVGGHTKPLAKMCYFTSNALIIPGHYTPSLSV